jgi:putative ABC transport system ATP-binding protein
VLRLEDRGSLWVSACGCVVTHVEKILPTFKRTYHIRDGRTVEEAGNNGELVGAS